MMRVFEGLGDLLRHAQRLLGVHRQAKAFGQCFGALAQLRLRTDIPG